MIKGILFDFDGTVSYRYLSAFKMFHWFLSKIDPSLDMDMLKKESILQRCLLWDQYGTINKRFTLEQLKKKFYPDLDIEKMYVLWYDHFHEHQYLMPQANEVLHELKEDFKLGMISNGPYESQMIKIKALKMDKLFDPILISGQFGKAKPDRKIYLAACIKMNLQPSEVAFVGDTFSTDIVGAIQAGLLPVWYCFERRGITDLSVKQVSNYEELYRFFRQIKENK